MARTVVALYNDFSTGQAVVRDLIENGFSREDISIVIHDPRQESGSPIDGSIFYIIQLFL